ncbi:hypothetical protein ZYGR_0A04210 [Zygosaccharomyces rouxii]|uniref:Glucosidase 2 subunit beta n=2 Tax=Zygosaccharomyces rouxii TaxID=4956 RepID=C5DQ88_ZYGRC|nr:uncharacterized protein ZYRO0A09548g [Zygosaccharomyces rouxii]KAH9198632.1 glucosidase II beta subunit-like-domain-containing protein [Zygosaccharomyces rouxii]GAV46824.1 hypothetical protein ZYGR_0A04210 [Zygosaccharomyces rouxii]CAR25849.1 ZYRO0A09548p [Zygosaccharomyces rouxii]
MVNSQLKYGLLGLYSLFSLVKGSEGVVGVPESRQSIYEPRDDGKWACLGDANVIIEATQINDGICDCPDGSDEPGTGACGMKAPQFYCKNGEFLPRYISQSKVGDGVCDCCDCSDEQLTKGEVFYRGTQCSDLRTSFDKFVQQELENHHHGMQTLLQLKAQSPAPVKTQEGLSEQIRSLSEQLSNNEKILASEKADYAEKLKAENPLLYEFEQLHVDALANAVNDQLSEIIRVGRAYEDLVRILDALVENYSSHLMDLVVNENVKKYQFYKLKKLSKISCNPGNDNEQREQLLVYFQTELPELFANGLSDKPAKYIQGKATFVDMLILSKAEYTEVIMEAINKLRSILQDVAENYNRNYQDQGVRQAAEAFKHYTEKYATVDIVRLPQDLMDELDHLKSFVIEKAPELVSSSPSLENQDEAGQTGVMQQVQNWVGGIPNFFKPDMRGQIEKHEQDVRSLRAEMAARRKELTSLVEQESSGADERTKYIKALIDATNLSLEKNLDAYIYGIQYNGQILQKEKSGDQNSVLIGNFKSLRLNEELALLKYKEYVRINYSGDDELVQHLISETTDEEEDYLFGNLYQLNNGLQLEFENGDQCWDGPRRSATVFVQCSDKQELKKITETSRCRYSVEIESPFGCSEDFIYQPFRAE